VVAAVLLGAAVLVLTIAPSGGAGALGIVLLASALAAVIGVVVAGSTGHERGAWSLTLYVAGLSVALFLAHGSALAT
jgi:hypothetical protein